MAGASETGIVTMDVDECRQLLRRQRLCVLATADGEQPYAVPLFYGFDGTSVFLGVGEGRKTRVLDRNPRLCIAVTELGPGDAWSSVLVTGRAEWVTDGERRARAIQVMMEHNRRPDRPAPPPDPATQSRRHAGGRMMQIVDAEITGRAKR